MGFESNHPSKSLVFRLSLDQNFSFQGGCRRVIPRIRSPSDWSREADGKLPARKHSLYSNSSHPGITDLYPRTNYSSTSWELRERPPCDHLTTTLSYRIIRNSESVAQGCCGKTGAYMFGPMESRLVATPNSAFYVYGRIKSSEISKQHLSQYTSNTPFSLFTAC